MDNINLDNIEEHLKLQNYFYYLAFMENDIKKEIERKNNNESNS